MIRKILTAIVIIPLVVLFLGFAVANRHIVSVSFDPFDSTQPAYAAAMPLFVLIFVLLILGVLVGGVAAWMRQSKWRRAARRAEARVADLRDEIEALRRNFQTPERAALPAPGGAMPPLFTPPGG